MVVIEEIEDEPPKSENNPPPSSPRRLKGIVKAHVEEIESGRPASPRKHTTVQAQVEPVVKEQIEKIESGGFASPTTSPTSASSSVSVKEQFEMAMKEECEKTEAAELSSSTSALPSTTSASLKEQVEETQSKLESPTSNLLDTATSKATKIRNSETQKPVSDEPVAKSSTKAKHIDETPKQVSDDLAVKSSSKAKQKKQKKAEKLIVTSQGVQKNNGDIQEANGLPVVAPQDPECKRLLVEGSMLFHTDKKKAVVLLKLAARKGYLSAYLQLAQLANDAGDDDIILDAMFELLGHDEAPNQVVPDLLQQCAMSLAALLRDPKYAKVVADRDAEIDALAKKWPILALPKLENSRKKGSSSGKKETADSLNGVLEAISKASSQVEAKTSSKVQVPSQKSGYSNLSSKHADAAPASTEEAERHAVEGRQRKQKKPEKTPTIDTELPDKEVRWKLSEDESSWKLIVSAPWLNSLADGVLEISDQEVLLRDAAGEHEVREALPRDADGSAAVANWSRKKQQLTVTAPRIKIGAQEFFIGTPTATTPSTSPEKKA